MEKIRRTELKSNTEVDAVIAHVLAKMDKIIIQTERLAEKAERLARIYDLRADRQQGGDR